MTSRFAPDVRDTILIHEDGLIQTSAKSTMATRKTLHGFLHEVGHVVLGHGKSCKLKRFERESAAESYATKSIREYGIPVPREAVALGKRYVSRMKQWGKNISEGRKS